MQAFIATLLQFASEHLHNAVAGTLVLAGLFFIIRFLIPGVMLGRELRTVQRNLSQLKEAGSTLDLDRIREESMVSTALLHCWDEYRDTLHGQKQITSGGTLEVSRWRATSMANAFFTEQALVDAPLRTEFYKHLPGILTGLGIIGTFAGLIFGLQSFGQVDLGDADSARGGLRQLLSAVGGAFIVSGSAIALAMLVTTIEKHIINGRYTEVEKLCGLVDSLFDSGAGEEYLQRLVEASETSATQTMQMKESLVTDLKQMLTELTQQQIAAMTATSAELGQVITKSLSDGLKEPLTRISNAVESVGSSQGEAVNKLLTDVLASFTEQMQAMFGSQMRGMSDMLVQTASTIEVASKRFDTLAGQIQHAGTGAVEGMAKRLDEGLQQMQARQAEANEQMTTFVEQMRRSISQGQSESAELTMSMMKELSASTGGLVQQLREQAQSAQQDHVRRQDESGQQTRALMEQLQSGMAASQRESADAAASVLREVTDTSSAMVSRAQAQALLAQEEHATRQNSLAEQVTDLLKRQSDSVKALTDAVGMASAAMQDATLKMGASTDRNIERLGTGAERLSGAADQLSANLNLMKASSDGISSTADKLVSAGGLLATALDSTQLALSEQKAVRDALGTMVSELRLIIENATREAGMTSELVNSLQTASQRLTEAQRSADVYLEGVTQVLGDSHAEFAKQMEKTLREGNKVFHEELAQATGLLKGSIQDLGDVLDALPTTT